MTEPAGPELVLGPMLRHVGHHHATVWVETSAPCRVGVLGHEAATFTVAGHHYALVVVEGLQPGSVTPYEVHLDGQRAWPQPDSGYPPSVVRTLGGDGPLRIAWGSCRAALPHRPPYTYARNRDDRGRETDAVWALAEQLRRGTRDDWPDLLLFAGDQVYADENISPGTVEAIRRRRDTSRPPGEEIADFAEYCLLYHESWGEPTLRWLLSTVASAMIFDDHDVRDDWNTSQAWRQELAAQPWWQDRIEGALMSYWVYQHLGNLDPDSLAADEVYQSLTALPPGADGEDLLRRFAARAEVEADGRKDARWSFDRELGPVRIVVVDSRAGRILEGDRRDMVDEAEWAWIEERLTGGVDHLVVVTSLPYLLPRALHHLEAWNEAVCDGAWGAALARRGERLRRALDLEHWAAFERSFRRLTDNLRAVATGRRGEPPASVSVLSGDVHFSYVATAFTDDPEVVSRVHQVVCSPMRNALPTWLRRLSGAARSRLLDRVLRGLAATAGVAAPTVGWRLGPGPWFDNAISTLVADGRRLRVTFDTAPPTEGEPVLRRRADIALAP